MDAAAGIADEVIVQLYAGPILPQLLPPSL